MTKWAFKIDQSGKEMELKMDKNEKICMYIVAHWMMNKSANAQALAARVREKEYDALPKCIKEDCGSFVDGHCRMRG